MQKKISFSGKGNSANIGDIAIQRILPNRYADSVGPFVFLDHMVPQILKEEMNAGTGAHPHRGIATLTYVLNGEGEHFDSAGNHAIVRSGGVQWMKAGNGIIHDETVNKDPQTDSPYIHGFQFWINLPSTNKKEKPEYLGVQANEIPQINFTDNKGWLKVIVGAYEGLHSKIPDYSKQLLYHIRLNEGKQFSFKTEHGLEYAVYLPQHEAMINDSMFSSGEFVEFDREGGTIDITNSSAAPIDILLFGGEKYSEPIVAYGPFVMNSMQEISQAYSDFHEGKYGTIKYK